MFILLKAKFFLKQDGFHNYVLIYGSNKFLIEIHKYLFFSDVEYQDENRH